MRSDHCPTFKYRFLLPRYWSIWSFVICSGILAFFPDVIRAKLGDILTPLLLRYASKRNRIALINLSVCYPERSASARHGLLVRHTRILAHTFLGYGQLLVRSSRHLRSLFDVQGMSIVKAEVARGKGIILLSPHSLALEYAAQYLTISDPMVCAVRMHSQNEVLDWIVSKFRTRYQGIIYDNAASMLGLVKLVRKGAWLYYLPDEDRGMKNAVFAPFYGTRKASLAVLGKLAKSCNASVIPMTSAYCPDRRRFSISFHEPLRGLTAQDIEADVTLQNQAIEAILNGDPAQYMWSAKIFRTRPEGEHSFY